jgi:hypothetical protein
MPNDGRLTIDVWPPYVGLTTQDPGPPGTLALGEPDDINYARGMIQWRTEGVHVLGSAHIYIPKGVFTHIVFFCGPHRIHALMGSNQLEQPVVFDQPGVLELNPIHNQDYLPR